VVSSRGDERNAASKVAERMGLAEGWTPGGAPVLVVVAVVVAAPPPPAAASSNRGRSSNAPIGIRVSVSGQYGYVNSSFKKSANTNTL
jgi:hypothetical protein